MDNEADVRASPSVGAADKPLVHEHCVCTALGHVVDGFLHVHETGDCAHGNTVVHGNDDGAAVVAIDDAFEADLFAEVHWTAPFPASCGMKSAWFSGGKRKRPPA